MRGKYPLEISDEGDTLTCAAKINDAIDKPEGALLSLKAEHNEPAPISVLPPELLSKIFILVRDLGFTEFVDQTLWLCVGQVCHRWREIALGCPSLWSTPIFVIPDLAGEMMQRSRMAALTVVYFTSSLRSLEELKNAMSQIHRIQSIDLLLGFDSQNVDIDILYTLVRSAPLLENFTLDVAFPRINDGLSSFPTDALSDAPRLRSITFHGNLNFSWESAIFKHRGLTDLRLSSHVDMYGNSSFGQMVDALRDLPNLRTLTLNGSIPPHTTSNGNEKTIELKFLEQLELDCTFLFRHIRYPPHTVVSLYCSSTGPRDWRTLFSLINSNLCHARSVNAGVPQPPVITGSLRLTGLSSPEISFRKDLQYPTTPFINIRLSNVDYPSNQSWVSLLPAVSDGFNLSSIQDLFLHWNFTDLTDSERHVIQDFFMKLPKLNILGVSNSNLQEICFAIAESPEDSSAVGQEETQTPDLQRRRKPQHSSPVTILPALRTLEIKKLNLHKHPWNVECLVDMLIKRSNMNVLIDRLSIERWVGRHTRQKRLLGELVIDLEIEGKVVVVKELDSDDDHDSGNDQDSEDEDMEDSDEDLGDYSDEYHSSNGSDISWGP